MNQDAVLAVRLADGRELVAVADGMGGHSAGEVASQRALETIWTRLKTGHDLRSAVTSANAELHALASENPAWRGMGTTLVAMLRSDGRYEIANVGDSRAYRITPAVVEQITADHSFVAEAMRDARLGTDEIVQSRWRNALTRALGTDAHIDVDVFGPFDAREPHALLLCSDGLHRCVPEDVLRRVSRAKDPWAAARDLAAEAYRNGSSDNISAAVVLFGDDSARQRVDWQVAALRPRRPRGHRSERVRRTEVELAVTLVLLVLVIAVLMRVW
ncbi:MAG TPA: protein phosphatase 2C domain-containing protein [Longimicrobiales bacterium]